MTREFEYRLSVLHNTRHAVFMASGTCALHVGLLAMKERHNWSDGSEVIIPATTFIATMSTVIHAGLVPVLADVDGRTGNLAPGQIDQHVTPQTVAVLVVHLLGQAADMAGIVAECERLNLRLIEDCCEAVGTQCQGRPVGSFGEFAAISTYVCHHVSTGVGGAVLTNSGELATLARSLMQHGRDPAYLNLEDDDGLPADAMARMMQRRYSFVRWGHSFRATELEAALGLGAIDEAGQSERRYVAGCLCVTFEPFRDWIAEDAFDEWSSPLFYPLITRNRATADGLALAFETNGIETRPMMPLVTQPIVRAWYEARGQSLADFPSAADLCERAFLIGCHPGMTAEHIEQIRRVTERFFVEGHVMARIDVERPDPELWSQAWCAESCAAGQHALASGELKAWLGGEIPHAAFDAFQSLVLRCDGVGSVLEIGCGAGYYAAVMQRVRPGVEFFGMDVSAAMIAIAKREYPGGFFTVRPAETLGMEHGTGFDLVILGSVLGCCDDWQQAVREAFRVSRRYVMLHRVAVHDVAGWPDVRQTVKTAYGVKMAERIIRESTILEFCEACGGKLVGEPVRWSRGEDGFQGSYLVEVAK